MCQELKRNDSGIFCLPTPIDSPMAQAGRQVTMENPRPRPQSLLMSSWASMSNLGIGSFPPDVYSEEEISRKAAQIVDHMLDSPSNPPQEELQHSVTLTTITEQETPLASPTNNDVYPMSQELLHPLNAKYLKVGPDDKYYPSRDYYLNDVGKFGEGKLGQGGFGTCLCAKDNSTEEMFVIKRNSRNEDDKIQSIRKESAILSTLHHENIVFFYGAVLDTYPSNARSCNMMMELAEYGALSSLLTDGSGPLPLGIEQSLYYLGQILQGVLYLHNKSVMHLDIKTPNVLVFNSGKTVKLADFGTSVTDNGSVLGACKQGVSPLYAAPEVVREEPPRFASDVWSAHCVFVELITAKLPWCFNENIESFNYAIYKVGCYDDCIEDIVPVKHLELEDDVVDLCSRVFKKDYKERPTAMALVKTPLFVRAQEYEKYFDGYVDDPDDQVETSVLPSQELCTEGNLKKMSVTSSVGTTDDSGISPSIYGRTSSWLSSNQCKNHMQEEESPLPSPSTQSFTLSNSQTHSAPSSITSQRPNQRRFSLGITSTRLDPDVEYDRAARCKAVQRSVSFSEAYVAQGPEIDLPIEDHRPSSARCSGHHASPAQEWLQQNPQVLNSLVPNQYHHWLRSQQSSPQPRLLVQSDQLNPLSQPGQLNPLSQPAPNTNKPEMKAEKSPEPGSDGTRLINFKYIV